jgi:hypothetical protein
MSAVVCTHNTPAALLTPAAAAQRLLGGGWHNQPAAMAAAAFCSKQLTWLTLLVLSSNAAGVGSKHTLMKWPLVSPLHQRSFLLRL